MYPDPKRVRENRVAVRLDDYEYNLLKAIADFRGEPLSTFMRDLLMQEAAQLLEQHKEPAG